jgi:hypothetical protein
MSVYTPTKHQREILEKLAQGVDKYVLGHIPHYDRSWLQEGALLSESVRVRTFDALLEAGWIERVIGYGGKSWRAGAIVLSISKAGRKKLGSKQEKTAPA